MAQSTSRLRTAKAAALLVYSVLVVLAAWKPPLLPGFLVAPHAAATGLLASVGIEAGRTLFEGDPADSIIPRRLCPQVVGQRGDRFELLVSCPNPLVRATADTLDDTLFRIGLSSWQGIRSGRPPGSPVYALMAWTCFSPQVEGTPWQRVFLLLEVEEMDFLTGERAARAYTSMAFDCDARSLVPPPWPNPLSIRPNAT